MSWTFYTLRCRLEQAPTLSVNCRDIVRTNPQFRTYAGAQTPHRIYMSYHGRHGGGGGQFVYCPHQYPKFGGVTRWGTTVDADRIGPTFSTAIRRSQSSSRRRPARASVHVIGRYDAAFLVPHEPRKQQPVRRNITKERQHG